MRQTVLRCNDCGLALEEKRRGHYRAAIEICFCFPWRHRREFVEVTHMRLYSAPALNTVQRE